VVELQRLSLLTALDIIREDGLVASVDVDYQFAAELLLLDELWARSYAQYVAIRSGSRTLTSSLNSLRKHEPGRVYYPLQWEDADFDGIDEAIEELFRRIGWRGLQKL
jgi:hypothetical protein